MTPAHSSGKGSPYERILGDAFDLLHPNVRRAHLAPLAGDGLMDVEHGARWWTRPLIRLMNLPAAGNGQSVHLHVEERGANLVWTRTIGRATLTTRQCVRESRLVERSGVGCVAFNLIVEKGALRYRQQAFHVAGVPIPAAVGPQVRALVTPTTEGWRVAVRVECLGQLVCAYEGALRES